MAVIDTFPFFNEFEIMELRLRLLDSIIDHFVISELDYTHSGLPKDFSAREFVDGIGMSHKVTVLEQRIHDHLLVPLEMDVYHAQQGGAIDPHKTSLAYVRERLQRDVIREVSKNFSDESIVIHSDCDEIIRPEAVSYLADVKLSVPHNIIKVPLVQLEGRADLRLFRGNEAIPWRHSMFICTANQMEIATPTVMRANYKNPFPPVWVVQDGRPVEDLGWHFTWMGGAERVAKKALSVAHADHLHAYQGFVSQETVTHFESNQRYDDSGVRPLPYPVEDLPKLIFEHEHLSKFFVPS